ncbi:MAG: hypothetical protein IPJ75_04175 [Ignavibacteriales bacterium]|nr:hypothetical protein [Ignavibacteriales bacterium]
MIPGTKTNVLFGGGVSQHLEENDISEEADTQPYKCAFNLVSLYALFIELVVISTAVLVISAFNRPVVHMIIFHFLNSS